MSGAPQGDGVSGDATLDSFAEPDDPDEREHRDASPLAVTSTWAPNGTCASCGASAARLWQDGDSRVCVACAPWTESGGSQPDQ
jgi:hypothetical protein